MLGIKGELDAAVRIWVIHILEPNQSVTNDIRSARKDVQLESGPPDQTYSDEDDYIWDGYFSENRICFHELYFKCHAGTETVSSVIQEL